jgi:RHS repeat-associated protein
LYLFPEVTVTAQGYTKHIFAGTERICSKVGTGRSWPTSNPVVPIIPSPATASAKQTAQRALIRKVFTNMYFQYPPNLLLPQIGSNIMNISILQSSLRSISTSTTAVEIVRYFYNADHLGSTSFVSDRTGTPLQYLSYDPFGKVIHNQKATGSSYNTDWQFSGKFFDAESRYSNFGARYYDSDIGLWLSVDPLASKYPQHSPYVYAANNPIRYVDPNGMDWEDADGNKIKDHSNIKAYIFYDPKSFGSQSKTMYNELEAKYGKGSVAMSNVTTTKEFAQDWGDMASTDIKEVNLNYHGGPITINLDWENDQYITSYGRKTPLGNPAMEVSELPTPSGNIWNAQLNINSCESNNVDILSNDLTTIAKSFRNNTSFSSIRTTSQGVSYFNWFSPNRPHPQDHSSWQFLYRPIPLEYPGEGLLPK